MIDTRSFLLDEILMDFDASEFISGRGSLGTYFSPYFALQQQIGNAGDSPIRLSIEIGYLFILLKSGIIGLVSYVFIYTLAIVSAIRSHQGRIAAGVIVLLVVHLIEMTISGHPSIYPSRIILWILLGTLLSKNNHERLPTLS